MTEDYYDPQRAAKILSLEPERVYEMLEAGELEGVRVENGWRIPKWEVHNRLHDPPEQDRRRALQDPRIPDLPPGPSST